MPTETKLTVVEERPRWRVVEASTGTHVGGLFVTNAEAWRWIDRNSGAPISRGEQVADWSFHND